MPAPAGHLRLRELRKAAGWTQQELADKLAYFAWTHGHKGAAVNANMVAKWERGAKGISARYRILLCGLFGVTPDQLRFAQDTPQPRPIRDPESLIAMLDDTAAMLDQLGAAGTALAPQMLAAWHETATSRRTMLGLLDPAATDPAGHAHAVTATVAAIRAPHLVAGIRLNAQHGDHIRQADLNTVRTDPPHHIGRGPHQPVALHQRDGEPPDQLHRLLIEMSHGGRHPSPGRRRIVITRKRRTIATALGEITAGHPTRTRPSTANHQHQPQPGRAHQAQTTTGIRRPGRPSRTHMRPPISPTDERHQKVRALVRRRRG